MMTPALPRSRSVRRLTAALVVLAVAVVARAAEAPSNPLGLVAHHVTALVLDVDRTSKWYQQVLGFRLVRTATHLGGSVRVAELEIPGFGVALVQGPEQPAKVPANGVVKPAWLHMVFAVADPAATFESLRSKDVKVWVRDGTPPGPVTTFLLNDIEGNEIEIVGADGASDQARMTARNRAIVERFVELFYRQRNVRLAFETYVRPDYIQHNPDIADGREAAIVALTPLFTNPAARFDIQRVIVDGDLAAVHLRGAPSASEPGAAVVDLFRLQDGRIVEHWDVLQPVPVKSANPHPLF